MDDYDGRLAQAQDFAAMWLKRAEEAEAERDRLRAVVDDALLGLRQLTDSLREHGDHDVADSTARLYRSIVGQLDGSADIGGRDSTEGAPHESDGDERTFTHGAPDPPNGGPAPPSTPAPRPDTAEPLLCDNCGQPLAEHLRSDGLLSCRDEG